MRKKLDTRFPAPRIKKIMQADEDVGKIAMAVPVLVSKALELFLQDLCDQTYEVTLKKGAKTINSLHLKECVRRYPVFDFLRDTVSSVPDLGCSDVASEDRSATKRRKIKEEEEPANDEEFKRTTPEDIGQTSSTGRGRGRGRGGGRGRGRGRSSRMLHEEKFEDDPGMSNQNDENLIEHPKKSSDVGDIDSRTNAADKSDVNIDLNLDLNENADSTPTSVGDSSHILKKVSSLSSAEFKHEDIPGWSLVDVERMAINPVELANLNQRMVEEEEDYDEDG